ncbi:MAG: nitroreductase family protein [Oscillospiraceae bacterium]
MTFHEMVSTRQSCRQYSNRQVEHSKLERIIDTARLSPSACNSQPWHMTVISGDRTPPFSKCLQNMGMNKFTSECPAFIVINEEESTRTAKIGGKLLGQHYAGYDIGLLVAHICFAAQEEGLSTCIVGWFDEKKIKDYIGLDKKKKVSLVICVGYAKEDDVLRVKVRKSISDIASFL